MSDALPEPYFLKSDFGIGGEKKELRKRPKVRRASE
jgi:hypothetical protein